MKNTLFICLFAMFALSGCVDDEEEFATGGNISPELTPENKENAVLNTAVFDQLNLDYPGLEKVKQYHEAGEDYLAASTLLEYYRMRANAENINRKTFCNAFPNHFVSLLHQLTQNKL